MSERFLRQREMHPELGLESAAQIGRRNIGERSSAFAAAERHDEVIKRSHRGEGAISLSRVCSIERSNGRLCAQAFLHLFQLASVPAIDNDRCAAIDQQFCRCQANARRASRNQYAAASKVKHADLRCLSCGAIPDARSRAACPDCAGRTEPPPGPAHRPMGRARRLAPGTRRRGRRKAGSRATR